MDGSDDEPCRQEQRAKEKKKTKACRKHHMRESGEQGRERGVNPKQVAQLRRSNQRIQIPIPHPTPPRPAPPRPAKLPHATCIQDRNEMTLTRFGRETSPAPVRPPLRPKQSGGRKAGNDDGAWAENGGKAFPLFRRAWRGNFRAETGVWCGGWGWGGDEREK